MLTTLPVFETSFRTAGRQTESDTVQFDVFSKGCFARNVKGKNSKMFCYVYYSRAYPVVNSSYYYCVSLNKFTMSLVWQKNSYWPNDAATVVYIDRLVSARCAWFYVASEYRLTLVRRWHCAEIEIKHESRRLIAIVVCRADIWAYFDPHQKRLARQNECYY